MKVVVLKRGVPRGGVAIGERHDARGVRAVDRLGGPVDDAVAMWKVRAARSAAWTNAQVLWGLRGFPRLRDRFFDRLDGLVGMTGRGLLLPLGPNSVSAGR